MALTEDELLRKWNIETDFEVRDQIVEEMTERGLFPEQKTNETEEEGGLYPDTEDPLFLEKLLRKQEFAENKQPSILELMQSGENPCDPDEEFELSPVQRFVGQFLSPKTPYNSALLYHGVGVGKTCSAITVAEAYLEMFPRKQVIIVAPPNIQPGFQRTIFNEERLKLGEEETEPNRFQGCTGSTYLKLTGMEYNRDKKAIMARVARLRSKRYQLFGYTQFYNHIRTILETRISKKLVGERRAQEEIAVLRQVFSGRLVIIDEAHNLRDIAGETEEESADAPGGMKELADSKAGKLLTPYLRRVLDAVDGMKLLLLTATPMYNSYREIIFLFNLLLQNDKKALLSESMIFNRDGSFTPKGKEYMGRIASAYLSFMRGENPLSFPIRLPPDTPLKLRTWPSLGPDGKTIPDDERRQVINLPFVPCPFEGENLAEYQRLSTRTIAESGLGLNTVDTMIQAGNWFFPSTSDDPTQRVRDAGFRAVFQEEMRGGLKAFRSRPEVGAAWLREDQIGGYSPKAAYLLRTLRTTKGVAFVYSRFVQSGAMTIAMALEANGYTLVGRDVPFLSDGNQLPEEGRQCALCERKERQHQGATHRFVAAKYVLLTGRDEYTPNNNQSVDMARADGNFRGEQVKVILGSQVASEGIDLRFIREVFVFDSWYHLNKLEQVIGRAIRMCSHALLSKEERNCTINLLITSFPSEANMETIDMYQYRAGFRKALQVGQVTRVLKQYAIDCNLNRDAILIQGLPSITQIDGQGRRRDNVNINDMPFTSVCDWIDTCDYACALPVDINPEKLDDTTYSEYASRWRENQIKEILRELFEKRGQSFYRFEDIQNILASRGVPRVALASILVDIAGNRSFRIRVGSQNGYIIYKNGLYLFQPEAIKDTNLPLSLRAAAFPVKRDSYEPITIEKPKPAPLPLTTAATAVKTTEEVASEGVVIGISPGYKEFWLAAMAYVDAIRAGTAGLDVPSRLLDQVKARYTSPKSSQRVRDSMGMITSWVYRFLRTNEAERGIYASVVADFIWDEFVTVQEQYALYNENKDAANDILRDVWGENTIQSGSTSAFRFVNPMTGVVQYMCDGKPCSPALIRVFEDEPTDILRGLKANRTTTAQIYGTVNYKRGAFVFKTNEAVGPEKKQPEIGSECANVSNIAAHYKLLERIGQLIAEPLGMNFDLVNEKMTVGEYSFKNSVRACALTDLLLRYLDKKSVGGKRWFYRPLQTLRTKHRGILAK